MARRPALFSFMVGRTVPYTGSIGARVVHLEPGLARVQLPDRRRVRNHLRSVHAIALANVGEFSTGLAALTALPDGYRSILTGIDVRYVKKARGTLTAEARFMPHAIEGDTDIVVEGEIRDAECDTVATVRALWRVGQPKR